MNQQITIKSVIKIIYMRNTEILSRDFCNDNNIYTKNTNHIKYMYIGSDRRRIYYTIDAELYNTNGNFCFKWYISYD